MTPLWPVAGPELNLISTKESARPLVEGSLGVWGDGSGGPQTEKDLMAGKLWEPRIPPEKQPRSLCQGPPTCLRAATHTRDSSCTLL